MAAAFAVLALASRGAKAQVAASRPLADALVFDVEGHCLNHLALVDDIAAWLGTGQVDASLSIRVSGDASRPVASFELVRAEQTIVKRSFEDGISNCVELQKALAFAVALAIDARVLERKLAREQPTVATRTKPATPPGTGTIRATQIAPQAPAATAQVTPNASITTAVTARATPTRSHQPHQTIAVDMLWLRGPIAEGLLSARATLAFEPLRWLQSEAGALASGGQSSRVGTGRSELSLLGAFASLCLVTEKSLQLRGCIGAVAAQMRAQGQGFTDPRRATVVWVAASASVDATWPATNTFALRVSLAALPVIRAPVLTVEDPNGEATTQVAAPPVGLMIGAGLIVRL